MGRAIAQARAPLPSTSGLDLEVLRGVALVGAMLLAWLLFVPHSARALELRLGDQPSVGAQERVNEDVYMAGRSVTSSGVLPGDLVAAGGNIVISSSVGNDLAAAGGSITILGNVADDVRTVGGSIVLRSSVGGDVVAAGGQLNLGGAGIAGDLLGAGGTVRVDAPVRGDVRITGENIYLNSAVGGNVSVFADTLTLGKNARIKGSLTYTAGKEATMEEGATVTGETNFTKRARTISVGGAVKVFSLAYFGVFLSQLIAALVLGLFFRRFSLTLVEETIEKPLVEVGRGLVIFIVLPVVSLLLLWSVLGIPLGILGLITFGAVVFFLWMMTPVLLGSLSYRAFFKGNYRVDWKTIILGVFIYNILGLIPIVGWITQFLLMLLTFGVAAKVKWGIAKEWR